MKQRYLYSSNMFIAVQIKYCEYVTNTTKLCFHVLTIYSEAHC